MRLASTLAINGVLNLIWHYDGFLLYHQVNLLIDQTLLGSLLRLISVDIGHSGQKLPGVVGILDQAVLHQILHDQALARGCRG